MVGITQKLAAEHKIRAMEPETVYHELPELAELAKLDLEISGCLVLRLHEMLEDALEEAEEARSHRRELADIRSCLEEANAEVEDLKYSNEELGKENFALHRMVDKLAKNLKNEQP